MNTTQAKFAACAHLTEVVLPTTYQTLSEIRAYCNRLKMLKSPPVALLVMPKFAAMVKMELSETDILVVAWIEDDGQDQWPQVVEEALDSGVDEVSLGLPISFHDRMPDTQARLVMTDCKRLCMQRDLPLTLAFESRALEITADVMKQMVHLTAGCGADFFQVGHPNQSLDNTGTLKLIGDALSALRLEGAGHCGIKAMLESSTLEEVHQAQKVISNHGGRGWFAHKDIARLILPDLLQES